MRHKNLPTACIADGILTKHVKFYFGAVVTPPSPLSNVAEMIFFSYNFTLVTHLNKQKKKYMYRK